MKTLLLFLLFPLMLTAQKKMVKIEGFNGQQIEVSDSIAEKTVKKFVFYMERNPIDYEEALRNVKGIVMIEADRYFVGEFKDGIIYLNSRLNDFPATKEIVILNYLAINTGAKMQTDFNVTEANEKRFARQVETNYIYHTIVRRLIESNPLRSKQ